MSKKSVIWNVDTKEFHNIVMESNSFTEILSKLGLKNKGGNHLTLRRRIIMENVDVTHIYKNINTARGGKQKLSNDELFRENSNHSRAILKRRIIEYGLLKYMCVICGLQDKWNNKPLVLILDHINGNSSDNRLINLRFVCPNCNSQLDTHCGKNNKTLHYSELHKTYCEMFGDSKLKKIRHVCIDCGKPMCHKSKSGRCFDCWSILRRKVIRPDISELKNEIVLNGYSAVARKYGVSDNAIRKWLSTNDKA